uniref:Odorant receptor n=1 Tax=Protaetia brevitarsis TaxID=348688 RepID=A0A411HR82_PROBE|nr:odorant receptor [Protaetia brevitarsis]
MVETKSSEIFRASSFFEPFLHLMRAFCWYSSELASSICYNVYSAIIAIFFIMLPSCLGTITVIETFSQLDEILDVLMLYTTTLSYAIKGYYFIKQKEDIRKLLGDVDLKIFHPKNAHQKYIISSTMLKIKRYVKIMIVAAAINTNIWSICSILNNDLPMSLWYPVNKYRYPTYQIICVYESLYLGAHGVIHPTLDAIPLVLMAFIIGQLDIITDILSNLKKYSEVEMNVDESDNSTKDVLHQKMNNMLIECVHKHRALIRLVQILNRVYTYHFFSILANCIITLAVLLYNIAMEGSFNLSFMYRLIFFFVVLFELLQFNWYANEIIYKVKIYTCYYHGFHLDE